MKTERILLVLGLSAAVLLPVLAHETHGNAGAGAAAFDPNAPKRPSAVTAAAIGLETAEVGFGEIQEVVRLGGTVRARPDKRVAISPPVAGTLRTMAVQPGDRVKRGDVVAVVTSPQFAQMVHEQFKTEVEFEHARSEAVSTKASLTTLRGQLLAAQRQADLAEQEVARLRAGADAVGANALAQREGAAIQARSQADALKLTIEQQTREWESLEKRAEASGRAAAALRNVISLVESGVFGTDGASAPASDAERTQAVGVIQLRSPLDGVVIRRSGTPGQGIEAGQTLAEVADYASVQVEGELPESLVDRLDAAGPGGAERGPGGGGVGRTARIRRGIDGPVIGEGVVRAGAPVIDPVKRTSHLIVDAENPRGALRDGMYVDLAVVLRSEKNAVVAPGGAIVSDGSLRFVFVKDGDQYVKRDVRIGFGDDRIVEILDGLVPGDVVVTRGAYALSQLRPAAGPGPGQHDHGDGEADHDHH